MSPYARMSGFGKFSLFPPVIKTIILLNVAVFVFQNFFLSLFHYGNVPLDLYFIKYLYLIPLNFDGADFWPWQLITYQFIHANFWHIFFNLFALWMFGAELESLWGSRKFLLFYLLCGIGAALVQLFISPMFSDPRPTIGASGAVYGILLAFGLTFPDRPIFMFPIFIPIPAKFFVLIYAGISLISGFTSNDGVAHFAHLGGALTGFILLKLGDRIGLFKFFDNLFQKEKPLFTSDEPRNGPRVYKATWAASKPQPSPKTNYSSAINIGGEEITQAKIDEILDKISSSGYQNLSDREKKILFELSQKLK